MPKFPFMVTQSLKSTNYIVVPFPNRGIKRQKMVRQQQGHGLNVNNIRQRTSFKSIYYERQNAPIPNILRALSN